MQPPAMVKMKKLRRCHQGQPGTGAGMAVRSVERAGRDWSRAERSGAEGERNEGGRVDVAVERIGRRLFVVAAAQWKFQVGARKSTCGCCGLADGATLPRYAGRGRASADECHC